MVAEAANQTFSKTRDSGHKQLVSNGGRFKLVVAERDKKQTMIDLREISTGLKRLFLDCVSVSGDGVSLEFLSVNDVIRVHLSVVQFAE